MRNYLAELDGEFSEPPTLGTAKTAKRASCSSCSDQGTHVSENRGPEGHHRLWQITEPDGTTWTASFTPPQTLDQVLDRYPAGTRAEPCPSATQPPGGLLGDPQAALVASALDAMGEDDPEIRQEILDKCARDPEALRYWLARGPNPRQALYQAWLSGISEPRALLSLDDAQVREAVTAGVVTREAARDSVLLLYRAPAGEHGPGAIGLLAIPRDRYGDFSPEAALQALSSVH